MRGSLETDRRKGALIDRGRATGEVTTARRVANLPNSWPPWPRRPRWHRRHRRHRGMTSPRSIRFVAGGPTNAPVVLAARDVPEPPSAQSHGQRTK